MPVSRWGGSQLYYVTPAASARTAQPSTLLYACDHASRWAALGTAQLFTEYIYRHIAPSIDCGLHVQVDLMDAGDRDGDGFLEYNRRNDQGLINQGWKDSYDSVFHANGTLSVDRCR
jgi:glycogen debranching enzyme